MKTKLLMTSSAVFFGIIGILLSFLPNEIAEYLSVEPTIITILFLQIFIIIELVGTTRFELVTSTMSR